MRKTTRTKAEKETLGPKCLAGKRRYGKVQVHMEGSWKLQPGELGFSYTHKNIVCRKTPYGNLLLCKLILKIKTLFFGVWGG